jgi:hypothetical protein
MNRNNPESSIRRVRDSIANVVTKAATRSNAAFVGGSALIAAGSASAQSAGFDASTVTAVIATMLAAGLLIWTAWTAARWTLKAFSIVGGKS